MCQCNNTESFDVRNLEIIFTYKRMIFWTDNVIMRYQTLDVPVIDVMGQVSL